MKIEWDMEVQPVFAWILIVQVKITIEESTQPKYITKYWIELFIPYRSPIDQFL